LERGAVRAKLASSQEGEAMGLIFEDALHDQFGTWPLGYAPYGGADVGEVQAVGRAVGSGDDGAFHDAWTAAGAGLADEAEAALAAGRRASARELFLRASVHYGASYHPLFGSPVDPRLLAAFRRQSALFDRAMALGPEPVARERIAFEGAAMDAFFWPAEGAAGERRPLLVITNGYDATIGDLYFFSAVAATRRGYHVLAFDGPGQGGMLIEQGVPMRPDWETVIRPVIDAAVARPEVDPDRIALMGISLGGHLALRAASGEPRIAAVVADPGLWSITGGMRALMAGGGVSDADAERIAAGDAALANRVGDAMIAGSRQLRWSIVQRGFWVHGVSDFAGYLRAAGAFTLDGRAAAIRCPALLTEAENDARSGSAPQVLAALSGPKALVRFTEAEGAGDHCEAMNRSRFNRAMLDWLDATLGRD